MDKQMMEYESEEFEDFEQKIDPAIVKIAKEVNEQMGGYEPSVVSVGQVAVMENT